MASKRNDSRSDANNSRRDDPALTVLERVQELTWALLDEGISDDEMSLLDTLLLSDDKARERYVECVQLHTDLMVHYAAPKAASANSGSASSVLGFLNTGSSSLDIPSPRVAD
ncbi:MAG: hypothetical protein L0228_14780 [Planctomycetes bacterium]|nr:hypothetical protein [Planctomycetota bacterium]